MFTRNLLSQWTEKQKYLRLVSFLNALLSNIHKSYCMNHILWNEWMKPKKRMIEFLALASSSLLKLGQENVHTSPNRESIYLLLGDIVKSSKVWIVFHYATYHYVMILLRNRQVRLRNILFRFFQWTDLNHVSPTSFFEIVMLRFKKKLEWRHTADSDVNIWFLLEILVPI